MKNELGIPRVEQETTNWCWAACAQMTINFLKRNKPHFRNLRQEQIVAVMYDVPVDRVSVQNPDCNRGANIKEIEIVFEEYAIRYNFRDMPLTYDALMAEIDAGRPVEIGIQWANGGLHAVVVYGYNTNGASLKEVLIRDPWKDTAPVVTVDYDDLINGEYGGRSRGTWVETFDGLTIIG